MTKLDRSTFEYLKPSHKQIDVMNGFREEFAKLADKIDRHLIDGADKTYIMRRLRTTAMWVNVALTRTADGTPREE